jgi:YesN/AraC family two-component response regulator
MYGVSCKEYIECFRIFKVEDFLLFTDFDLTYISQETGYSDCSHMIKQFKKYRGITPKQFRLKGGNI